MKTTLLALMLSVASFGGEIGREVTIGNLHIRTIQDVSDVTVYAMGGDPESRAIEVTAVIVNGNSQSKVTRLERYSSSLTVPTKIVVPVDGARVIAVHVTELGARTSQTVQP